MRTKTHTLIVFAVAALSAPLFSIPVYGTVPRAAAVVPLPPPAWTVYVLVGGVPVDVTDSASHGEGHVYLNGVLLGDIAPDGSILDGNAVVVGFVVVEP
ncbi:hypothetical protein [Armatimonas sp.]|uniref:hypothetical protein n=1 Tax=Armatimonas sp. TaxID=1872638 RepID=UPI003753DE52